MTLKIKKIIELGPGSLLYKADISRAFRQLKVDPGDLDLLCLKHQSYFIDQSVPFRYRHGSVFFEKVTDSIRYIMKQHGFPHLYNYVDDLTYCGLPSNIHQSFETLLELLTQLGPAINLKKLMAPCTSLVCLVILINTETRTMSVPPDKLDNVINMCYQCQTKQFCSKRQLQSLLGSLLYVSKCVRPARMFLNCMLMVLRIFFLRQFNGVVYYDTKPVQAELHLYASLTGMGEFLITSVTLYQFQKNFKITILPIFR